MLVDVFKHINEQRRANIPPFSIFPIGFEWSANGEIFSTHETERSAVLCTDFVAYGRDRSTTTHSPSIRIKKSTLKWCNCQIQNWELKKKWCRNGEFCDAFLFKVTCKTINILNKHVYLPTIVKILQCYRQNRMVRREMEAVSSTIGIILKIYHLYTALTPLAYGVKGVNAIYK